MGFFKAVKDNFKKSQAAVVVQNLLEIQKKSILFDDDPAKTANKLIGTAWDEYPYYFDGRFGQRPHKVSVAAFAFSNEISKLGFMAHNKSTYVICLGNILSEIEVNGRLYPFNSLDQELFEEATRTMIVAMQEFEESGIAGEVDSILNRSEND